MKDSTPYKKRHEIAELRFISRAKIIFPQYSYDKVKYFDSQKKVIVICNKHGEFQIMPRTLLKGVGCPYCNGRLISKLDCEKEALKYERRGDFEKECPKFYNAALRNNWLDEICRHMKGRIKQKSGWWDNIENCIETSSKFRTPKELADKEPGCYCSITRHKWQDICYKHMVYRHPLTYERCNKAAKECKTYKEFRDKYITEYNYAFAKGFLDEICSHMPHKKIQKKSIIPLNKQNCKIIAEKFETRSEFQKFENGRWYSYARRNGILDEVCCHMKKRGNRTKRCIYIAKFSDNFLYVGLTWNPKERWSVHLTDENSAIYLHEQETGLKPIFEVVHDFVNQEEAGKLEGDYIEKFRNEGWYILNRAKAGALGGGPAYTKEEVLKAAAKYTTLKEFREKDSGHYEAGYRSDYWNEVREICHPLEHTDYTKEELLGISCRYESLSEFKKNELRAYQAAQRKRILSQIRAMMKEESKECHIWTEDELMSAVKQCKTKKELRDKFPRQYDSISRRKDRQKFFSLLIRKKYCKELTKDEIVSEAKKYKTRSAFRKNSQGVYHEACIRGILDDVCKHMINPKLSYICKTLGDAFNRAKECSNRTMLKNKFPKAYEMLRKGNKLEEACSHMSVYKKPIQKWTPEEREKAAAMCSSRTDFHNKFKWAHHISKQNDGEMEKYEKKYWKK